MHDVLSDATVLELVEHVYAAGCDPSGWQRVVEEVHAQLPGIAISTHLHVDGTNLTGHASGIAPEHVYRLTNAEIEVVLQIAAGVSVAEAADALGVARATARNQLAAAMAKMGVHRQGELVAVVAGLAPRLRLDRGG